MIPANFNNAENESLTHDRENSTSAPPVRSSKRRRMPPKWIADEGVEYYGTNENSLSPNQNSMEDENNSHIKPKHRFVT